MTELQNFRNDLGPLNYGDCSRCGETIIWAIVKKTQKNHSFDPRPVASSSDDINQIYKRHHCKGNTRDEEEG